MQFAARINSNDCWQSLWWLVVAAIAILLKHFYSVAETNDLEWIFYPLALLLELLTGHGFEQNQIGEWASYSANVRLVKACAGMNFMIMSFVVYCWVLRPDAWPDNKVDWLPHFLGQWLLLCAAIIAAWITCLIANSFRIVIAMEAASQHWALPMFGIGAEQLHRLIGLFIYIPFLSLQILLSHRSIKQYCHVVLGVPLLLYLILTVLVPILTGNALKSLGGFWEHVLSLLFVAILLFACFVAFLLVKKLWATVLLQVKRE